MGWGKRAFVWALSLWLFAIVIVHGIGWGPGFVP